MVKQVRGNRDHSVVSPAVLLSQYPRNPPGPELNDIDGFNDADYVMMAYLLFMSRVCQNCKQPINARSKVKSQWYRLSIVGRQITLPSCSACKKQFKRNLTLSAKAAG